MCWWGRQTLTTTAYNGELYRLRTRLYVEGLRAGPQRSTNAFPTIAGRLRHPQRLKPIGVVRHEDIFLASTGAVTADAAGARQVLLHAHASDGMRMTSPRRRVYTRMHQTE